MNRRYNKILAMLLAMVLALNIAGCRTQGGPQTAGTQESAQADTGAGDEGLLPGDSQNTGEEVQDDTQDPADDIPGEADSTLFAVEPASWMNSSPIWTRAWNIPSGTRWKPSVT